MSDNLIEATFERAKANEKLFLAERTRGWDGWAKRFKERHGYDGAVQLGKAGFSLAAAARQLSEKYKLSEAVTQDQVMALAIGLVRTDLSSAYQAVPTLVRQLAEVLPSTKLEESYFPMFEGDVPTPVNDTEPLPEDRAGGVMSRIRNYKFGKIKSFSNLAADDDQTGALRRWGMSGGQKMGYAEDQWWLARLFLAYVAGNIRSAGGIIPPMCVAGSAPANYGGPATTAGPVSRDAVLNLWTAADFITTADDNLALIECNAGIFSNADKPTVRILTETKVNPNTPSGTANVTPGVYAANPLYGLFAAFYTRFMNKVVPTASTLSASGSGWGLGEQGMMGAFQPRKSLEVSVEAPNAGTSWEASVTRVKYEARFGAGVPVPEKFLRGN